MVDRLERYNDYQESIRTAMDAQQGSVWTALPAIVTSVNLSAMTLEAQPAIMAKHRSFDGSTVTDMALPLCVDCPILWPHGGGFLLTFPISPGDEVLLVFGSRTIDGWWQEGGVQPQLDTRMHDLSDGFAIPGPWSQKRRPGGVSGSSAQLRSMDGATVIDVAPGALTLTAAAVTINSPAVAITGASLTHNGVNIGSTHKHGGVQAGGSTTAGPQ